MRTHVIFECMDSGPPLQTGKKNIFIGSLELGRRPCVAAVIDDMLPVERLIALRRKGVDLFEVRVDLINTSLACITKYIDDIARSVAVPLIGTVRENERTAFNRLHIFEAIIPLVDCVDIELGSPIGGRVAALARRQGKTVMVSEHDFEKTPDDKGLQAIVDRASGQGADIVKIAALAASGEDAWRLLRFAASCTMPIVAFAMGENGAFSRVEACSYGSLFTYGYISRPVAPGQLSAEELVEKVKKVA
jgi:3-dehydroquinate dehydratase-1